MTQLRLDNRVAIVTGAGGNPGLGRSYALLLASRGAQVVVNDIGFERAGGGSSDNAAAQAVVDEIIALGGSAVADTSNVADEAGCQALVATALREFGRVDILVNNAGKCIFADVCEMTARDIRSIIDVNLFGMIWMTRAVLPLMQAQNYGRIINTTTGAVFGVGALSTYAASKGAVIGFTRSVAAEVGLDGPIRCNMISPQAGTRMTNVTLFEGTPAFEAQMAFSPDQVAPVVGYLAHESCELNGEWLNVGGGEVCRVTIERSVGVNGLTAEPEQVAAALPVILNMEGSSIIYPVTFASGARPYVAIEGD